jgi:AraC family transcriptional regulator
MASKVLPEQSPQEEVMDGRVRQAVALMKENLHSELPLSEIAQSVNLSSWRLCHLFKEETGTSPTHYLKWLRMQRAKELLETTFLSVKEIRDKVGVRDESHFVRNFKGFYGLSPMQYRIFFLGARLEGGNGHNPAESATNI